MPRVHQRFNDAHAYSINKRDRLGSSFYLHISDRALDLLSRVSLPL
jgi:hypothetical protein